LRVEARLRQATTTAPTESLKKRPAAPYLRSIAAAARWPCAVCGTGRSTAAARSASGFFEPFSDVSKLLRRAEMYLGVPESTQVRVLLTGSFRRQ